MSRRRLGLEGGELIELRHRPELSHIESTGDGLRVGAMTRIADLAVRVAGAYPALALTAGSLATPQIRAVGTVGGNLLQRTRCPYFRHAAFSCLKSGGSHCPARSGDHGHGVVFDLGPCIAPHPSSLAMALAAYDARIETSKNQLLTIQELLGDGSDGTRDHQLPEGVVLTSVVLPAPVAEQAAYRRVTGRRLAEWPIVEAVCRLGAADGVIEWASVAAGGVAPVPIRLVGVEEALHGLRVDDTAGLAGAAGRSVRGASPLPMTGAKVSLLEAVVLDVIESALSGSADSELAVGERGL